MKRLLIAAGVLFATMAAAGAAVQSKTKPVVEPSQKEAQVLQTKIDAIKKKAEKPASSPTDEIEVSEIELASYVMFELRDQIPVQLDSIKVSLTTGAIGAEVRLYLPEPTGTSLIDLLIGGHHTLFVKGKLSGAAGRGQFTLDEVRVDGIPVPKLLVETLVAKFVTPKYPNVDLKKPFDLPWSIQRLTLEPQKGRIVY